MKIPVCELHELEAKLTKTIYGHQWVCQMSPYCDARVGCHPGTKEPLGTLATSEVREARIGAHAAFDALWKRKIDRGNCTPHMARTAGYRWLAGQLGIPEDRCHIAMFDAHTCRQVVRLCEPYIPKDARRKK